VADDRIKGVSLTGSEAAGVSVASEAGKKLKKSVLELGGNDAFIVLEDADIDKAVEWAVVGRMNNNGECCVASKRIIVLEKVADEFLGKFKDKLSKMKVGDPMDPSTELGPLSSEEAAVHLVFINHPTWTHADLPFGGTKGSGYGRELSELGINEFVNKKLIRISELADPF
jgi:succinate-semialdehyde dehydrogenase/glutarate-semialdehyde dehydrogenase